MLFWKHDGGSKSTWYCWNHCSTKPKHLVLLERWLGLSQFSLPAESYEMLVCRIQTLLEAPRPPELQLFSQHRPDVDRLFCLHQHTNSPVLDNWLQSTLLSEYVIDKVWNHDLQLPSGSELAKFVKGNLTSNRIINDLGQKQPSYQDVPSIWWGCPDVHCTILTSTDHGHRLYVKVLVDISARSMII